MRKLIFILAILLLFATPAHALQTHFPGFYMVSPYGWRTDPINRTSRFHTGVDLTRYHNAPVRATVPGVVTYARYGYFGSGYSNYGLTVAVQDRNNHTHMYAHLSQILVSWGDNVQRGDVVGLQGATGRTTGSHLHYEVRAAGFGSHIEPLTYLYEYYARRDNLRQVEVVDQHGQPLAGGVIIEGRTYGSYAALLRALDIPFTWEHPNTIHIQYPH